MPINFEDHNPITLEEAIDVLKNNLDPSELELVKQTNPNRFHHSFGMQMRNEWKLWQEGSPLYENFKTRYNLTHADDMSSMILSGLHASVRDEEFDFQAEADRFHEHWAKNS